MRARGVRMGRKKGASLVRGARVVDLLRTDVRGGAAAVRLVRGLNRLEAGPPVRSISFAKAGSYRPPEYGAWRAMDMVLRLPRESAGRLSAPAEARFNAIAERCSAGLAITDGDAHFVIRGPLDDAVTAAWTVLRSGWLSRIRRCARCGRWFIDQTRNHSKQRCSTTCTYRWWNRGRRSEAGHKRVVRRALLIAARRRSRSKTSGT